MNSKPNIFRSRKFWIAVVDCVGSLLGIWVGVLMVPDQAVLVVASFAAIQVPIAVLINSIAQQNVAAMKAGLVLPLLPK